MEMTLVPMMDPTAMGLAANTPVGSSPVTATGDKNAFASLINQAALAVESLLLTAGQETPQTTIPLPEIRQNGAAQDITPVLTLQTEQVTQMPVVAESLVVQLQMPPVKPDTSPVATKSTPVNDPADTLVLETEPAVIQDELQAEMAALALVSPAGQQLSKPLDASVKETGQELAIDTTKAIILATPESPRQMTAAGTQQAAMVASVPETVPKIEMVGVPGKEVPVQAQVELPRQTQIKGQAQTQAAGQTPGQALVPGQVQTQVIEAVTVAEAQPVPLATETEQKISKHAEAMKRSPMPPVVALQVQEPSRTSATQPLDVAIEIGIAEQSRPIGASAESGLFSEQNSQEHTPSTPQQLGQVSAHPAKAVELPVAAAAQPLAQPVSQSVLEQVRDHLARREVTTNGNLVRLQLNPAELGELQITLHMDDKRLRVEILTENKAVKAALLDNMDSLKDILSRQHIAMERFDVGTGSNSGQFFREGTASEAQARPLPKFLNGNGNKLGAETGAVAAWQPRSNALVDVRF